MQRLLSDGLVIIAMHSALLFRNHYEARIRSLTSFCLADLLVLTMGGGSEGERERGGDLMWLRRNGGGKVEEEKERGGAQFSKIEF